MARPVTTRPPSRPPRKPINPKPIRGRRPGLLDLPALMLPALIFNAAAIYVAWAAWWI